MFHNRLTVQSGAYQNSTWVAAVAKGGAEDGHPLIAGSMIVNPDGEIVAEANTEDDELIVADCDLDATIFGKETIFDFKRHRRIEHYGRITSQAGVILPPESMTIAMARLGRNQEWLNCTAPSAMVTAAWVGSMTGMPSACSSGAAVARHARTTHHQGLGTVFLLQLATDIDHALERRFATLSLGDRHFEWAFTGKAVHEPHLAQITQVPGDRALADGNDAEASGVGERGQDAAFSDAEDRPLGSPGSL